MNTQVNGVKSKRGSVVCIIYAVIGAIIAFIMCIDVDPIDLGADIVIAAAILSSLLLTIGIWTKIVENRASAISAGIILALNGVFFLGFAIFSFIANLSSITATINGKTSDLHGASGILAGIGVAWGLNLIRESIGYFTARGK